MEKLMKLLKNDPAFEKEFTDLLKARDFKAVIRLAGEHEIELEEADFAPIETREMDSNELENVAAGIKSSCTTTSKLDKGSSNNNIDGSITKALARATRCC